jgi:hypothetical protein
VGQTKNPKDRNRGRELGKCNDAVTRFSNEHPGECTYEVLDLRVWDIPVGHYANAIENAFMDTYETHIKYRTIGLNKCYEHEWGEINFCSIGGILGSRKNPGWFGRLSPEQKSSVSKNMTEGARKRWDSLSPEEMEYHADQVRNIWARMTPEEYAAQCMAQKEGWTPQTRKNMGDATDRKWNRMTDQERKEYVRKKNFSPEEVTKWCSDNARQGHIEKDTDGKSVLAKRLGSLAALRIKANPEEWAKSCAKGTHTQHHLRRDHVNMDCNLCHSAAVMSAYIAGVDDIVGWVEQFLDDTTDFYLSPLPWKEWKRRQTANSATPGSSRDGFIAKFA